jgi:hypothetical protein
LWPTDYREILEIRERDHREVRKFREKAQLSLISPISL